MPKPAGRARRRQPRPAPATSPSGSTTLRTRTPDAATIALAVPHLPPETLHRLVQQRGLADCGQIVAAATPAQLATLLDMDLWGGIRPGQNERLDVGRFSEWLELLAEADAATGARTLAAMDPELVAAGLSRQLRVVDLGTLEPTEQSDDEPRERPPHDGPEWEFAGYLLQGTGAAAWDAVVALLLALHDAHPERFHVLLRGVRSVSSPRPEVDGLDALLQKPEQLLHDVTGEREARRTRQGYGTAADARAFLQRARERSSSSRPDPIHAAYLRAMAAEAVPGEAPGARRPPPDATALDAVEAVTGMLAESDGQGVTPRPALGQGPDAPQRRLARIGALLEHARDRDAAAYSARERELAFLANMLLAGCSVQSRAFTPPEATEAVAGVCQLGLELWPPRPQPGRADGFLLDHDLVAAFQLGWSTLYDSVCRHAAEALVRTLGELRSRDASLQATLLELRRQLLRHEGRPWEVRDALEAIAVLDGPAWAGLVGILDECPVLPAALTATVEGSTRAVSATDFDFFSTMAQVETAREFVRRLPGILHRGL